MSETECAAHVSPSAAEANRSNHRILKARANKIAISSGHTNSHTTNLRLLYHKKFTIATAFYTKIQLIFYAN